MKNYYCPWLIKRFNLIDLKVGQETTLRCEGDGSPYPNFEWQQLVEGSDPSMTKILRRANNTVLHIRFDSCELFILQRLKEKQGNKQGVNSDWLSNVAQNSQIHTYKKHILVHTLAKTRSFL